MWILVLLVVAFVVWHFLPASKPSGPSPRFRHDQRAKADDPDWPTFIAEHCESPAETAFLTAMIKAYQLQPEMGSLVGSGLKLDFQVGEGRYRADFLADEWLVIEIDGAAWHSSPEAQARDRARDAYFESLGYTVLRIPAKVVFNSPTEAVDKVRSAREMGKRQIDEPEQARGMQRLGTTLAGIKRGIGDLSRAVHRQADLQAALSQPQAAFSAERALIDSALANAESAIQISAWYADNPARRTAFEEHAAELDALFENAPKSAGEQLISVPDFLPPQAHSDPETDALIKERYRQLAAERSTYFADVRRKLNGSAELRELAKGHLTNGGSHNVWIRIA